jgi:hypothetical protein
MSKRNKGTLGSLLVATSCLALTQASPEAVDKSSNHVGLHDNVFSNNTASPYLEHNTADPSPGSTATPFADGIPSTAETFGPITSASLGQTITPHAAPSSPPHHTSAHGSSAVSVPPNHDVAPSSYRISKQPSLVPDSVATRKAGLSLGVGKGRVLECGWYNVKPGWQELTKGYGGTGGEGKGDADALMRGYHGELLCSSAIVWIFTDMVADSNTTSRMPFGTHQDSFNGWNSSPPPSSACPPCPSDAPNPLADQLDACLAHVDTLEFKQRMADDLNMAEASRFEVWEDQLRREREEQHRDEEGLARGWDELGRKEEVLHRQEINLGVEYRRMKEHDPVSLSSLCGCYLVLIHHCRRRD